MINQTPVQWRNLVWLDFCTVNYCAEETRHLCTASPFQHTHKLHNKLTVSHCMVMGFKPQPAWNVPQWMLESSLPVYKWQLPVELYMPQWPPGYPAIVKVLLTAFAAFACAYYERPCWSKATRTLSSYEGLSSLKKNKKQNFAVYFSGSFSKPGKPAQLSGVVRSLRKQRGKEKKRL